MSEHGRAVYDRIERLCNERGITPWKLAQELGFSQAYFTAAKTTGSVAFRVANECKMLAQPRKIVALSTAKKPIKKEPQTLKVSHLRLFLHIGVGGI